MKNIPPITLLELMERYDVFFVDQFGVLRDDTGAYDGAAAALGQLKAAGKTVVILSNSGRSGEYNAERFVRLGFDRGSFDDFVTSGDVAYDVLSRPGSPVSHGDRCFTISSGDDTNLATRLGLSIVASAANADVVVISGSEAETVSMDRYRQLLQPAAERRLPCFCTNPDVHKLANGTIAPGAGSIARLYEELGGTVKWLGKPYRDIYDYALLRAGLPPRERVVCIGDSIEHDIRGAIDSGLDSVLVETGILADKTTEERAALMTRLNCWPTFMMRCFKSD